MQTVRIAAAQTAEFRENVDAALRCATDFIVRAEAAGASLLCFPEGFLQGYLTDAGAARRAALDLASPAFRSVLERFPKTGPAVVMGMIEIEREQLFNTAVVVQGGTVIGRYRKAHLLGSERIFAGGAESPVFDIAGLRFGIAICNDTNFPRIARAIADQGASLIVCPANNMLRRDVAERFRDRHNAVRGQRCRETGLWLISSDVTGESEDHVGWGPTAVLDPTGGVAAQLPLGEPGLLVFDMPVHG
jgi:predicted amidohydrolase